MFDLPIWRRLLNRSLRDFGSTAAKLHYDAFSRPHFAFCLHRACYEAARLGISTIAAIEFGVAGGNGLVALEEIAKEVGDLHGVTVKTYGFDAGSGMPPALDYRDTPYIWQPGHFALDEDKLRSRLKSSKLFVGDVADTLPEFCRTSPPTIGFISIDTDYYSSAKKVLALFDMSVATFLPRTFCYFDDIVGYENEYHSEFTGELLAIREFNDAHQDQKIAPINGLRYKRRFQAHWNDMVFILHRFQDQRYNSFINPVADMQRALA